MGEHLVVADYVVENEKYLMWYKVGEDMKLVDVMTSSQPYKKEFEDGRVSTYVDVFGYGVKDSVNVKKLKKCQKQEEMA